MAHFKDPYKEARRKFLHRQYKEFRAMALQQPDGPIRSYIQAQADQVVEDLIQMYEADIKERGQQSGRTN